MHIFLLISITVFVTYLVGVSLIKGIPNSISESYYVLGEDKLISSLFTWFCWITGGTLLPYWIDYQIGDLNILPFLACSALMFVGTAPMFKSHQKKIHFGSAVVCFIAAYIWLFLYADFPLICMSLIAQAGVILSLKKKVFWAEVVAFITIYIALL